LHLAFISVSLIAFSRWVGQRLPKIHYVPEATTHQEKDNQDDLQEASQAQSPPAVVAASVSIKSAAAKQQNQHDNQK
jgi:hypothetical protein